jgi:hypothetical protein
MGINSELDAPPSSGFNQIEGQHLGCATYLMAHNI